VHLEETNAAAELYNGLAETELVGGLFHSTCWSILSPDQRAGRTIQATALAHEAYLKLIDVDNVDCQHRAHFFAISLWLLAELS